MHVPAKLAGAALIVIAVVPPALATQVTWVNPAGGAWSVAANWSTGQVPTSDSDVVLPDLSTPYTVTLNGAYAANSLTLEASSVTLWIVGGSAGNAVLTVTGNVTNAGVLRLESVGVATYCQLGSTNGTITNDGVIEVNRGALGGRYILGDIVNNGSFTVAADYSFDKSDNRNFTQAGGALTAGGGLSFGNLTFNYTGGTIIGEPVLTSCTFGLNAPDPASLVVRGSCTITSDIAAGQSVWIQGSAAAGNAVLSSVGSITNAGVLRLESLGASSYCQFNVGGSGTQLINLGTIQINRGALGGRYILGDIVNNGSFTVAADYSFDKSDGGRTFTQAGGTLTAGGGLSFGSLTFNYTGGTIAGEPVLTSCTFGLNAPDPASLVVRGSCTITSDIAAGQSVWIQGSAAAGNAVLSSVGSITNAGVLRLESLGASSYCQFNVGGSGTLTNTGTILINRGSTGARYITGDVVNNGDFTVAADCSFDKSDNRTFTQAGGALSAGGGLSFGSLTFNYTGGTIIGEPVLTSCTFGLLGVNPASVVARGSCTLTSNIGAAHTLTIRAGSGAGNSIVTAGSSITNDGTVRLESVGAANYAQLALSSGTLTNNGLIDVELGVGGARYLNCALNNAGTLQTNANLSLSQTGAQHVNSGTILVQDDSGLLTVTGTRLRHTAGMISVDAGRTLELSGCAFTYQGGTIEGELLCTDSSITLSTVSPGAFIARGACTLTGDISASQSVWVRGDSSRHSALAAATGFANNGLLRLASIGAATTSDLSVADGVLTNNGTFEVLFGSGGSRSITGSVSNFGLVFCDAGAAASITRQYLQAASGELHVEIGGPLATEFSRILFGTSTVLAGTLTVSHVFGYDPPITATYEIVRFNSAPDSVDRVAGMFDTLAGDGDYIDSYSNISVRLTREDAPCPTRLDGDVDGDQDVDLADLSFLLENFGRVCR